MRAVWGLLYFLLLIGLQGALSALLSPRGVTPPDLFLLTAVALALRLRAAPALLAAYGVGLLQDVLGSGLIGLHAAGAAGGALVVVLLRRYLTDGGALQTSVSVLAAVAGQWAVFLLLTYWLRGGLVTVDSLGRVLPWEAALTLLVWPLWNRVMTLGLGARPGADQDIT